ncbi:redoxin family protein [Flavitalea antarctica]
MIISTTLKKRYPVLILFTIFLGIFTTGLYANPVKENIQIRGEVVGIADQKKVYLQRYFNKMFFVIDSSVIKNGRFSFSTKLELPELYGLAVDTSLISPVYLFIDETKEITVKLDTSANGRKTSISGSAATDRFRIYQKNARATDIEKFIREDPSSIVSAFVLYRYYSPSLSADDLIRYTALLDKSLSQTQYVKLLNELPVALKSVSVGSQAPDFQLPDPGGKTVKLSEHFGKVLLVDFWAAWCGPCRRENPNIVRIHNKYKEKGFDVFGVSLDSKKEAWVKAIEKDNLRWTQVSDLRFWDSEPAKLYGIRGIPGNVLLDKSGKIVARNIHGEELEKKLDELLK